MTAGIASKRGMKKRIHVITPQMRLAIADRLLCTGMSGMVVLMTGEGLSW
jgi:hypothetical protein